MHPHHMEVRLRVSLTAADRPRRKKPNRERRRLLWRKPRKRREQEAIARERVEVV